MRRRDLVLSLGCVAAAGAAAALHPHRRRVLLQDAKLTEVVPKAFGTWSSQEADDLVAPDPESLSAKLYSQTLSRAYNDGASGAQVMVLLAYGGTQSDDLQLHRPETCYPAFGYEISHEATLSVPLGGAVTIPGRRLSAAAAGRREAIVYWARMGEFFPDSARAQRVARLRMAIDGYVGDGILARFSVLAQRADDWADALRFIPQFISAVPPQIRPALIGSSRAAALA
jgi:EpsI family protein